MSQAAFAGLRRAKGVFRGCRGFFAQGFAKHAGVGIHFHIVQALAATQLLFPAPAPAPLAHKVAHGKGAVCAHFLLVGFCHIAQHVGEKFAFGVAALGAHHNFQPRPFVDFRFYARHQIKVDIGEACWQMNSKGLTLKRSWRNLSQTC